MTITVLIENHEDREGRGLASEHGLSLLVDAAAATFLFDTGASGRFLENARRLGRSIENVPCAAISHGHYDHGGGLKTLLEANSRARVFVQRGAFEEHFARDGESDYRSIGLDRSLRAAYEDRFELVDDAVEMLPDVWLVAGIDGAHPLPRDMQRFCRRAGAGYQSDDFSHELMAVVRDGGGLVVLAGCSHRGILNVVETAERRFPGEPIRTLVGGFHLPDPESGKLAETAEEVAAIGRSLRARDGLRVWTGHCSGSRACGILERELGARMTVLSTGMTIET
jgi:7,8-dihydropterin-6-yl-methyl-4-(beta-D-ribofuranosyl)aminobenzene 5'-phosphate synthase